MMIANVYFKRGTKLNWQKLDEAMAALRCDVGPVCIDSSGVGLGVNLSRFDGRDVVDVAKAVAKALGLTALSVERR